MKVTEYNKAGNKYKDEDAQFVKTKDSVFGQKYYCIDAREGLAFRADPMLVQVVEEMGEGASGMCANLTVVEIPDDVGLENLEISEYDGIEHVAEKHRTWS
jgi:hypothetical protein